MKKTASLVLFVIIITFSLINCGMDIYEVTFELDGGNINGNTASVNIQVKSGENINNLPNPTKEGYIFDCWLATENQPGYVGSRIFTASTSVISNLTVYAVWLNDNEFIKIAYDDKYKYPNDFYYEKELAGSVYYVNTLSIMPSKEREQPFIELHTLDKEEAKYWSIQTESNGSGNRIFVSENETEKYFEFLWIDKYEYILLSRVHKSDYFIPLEYKNPYNTLGMYNGELSKSNVKELIEYLWDYPARLHYGNKVLESVIIEKEDIFEHNIQSLEIVFGDWGMRDRISVYDNKFIFDKETRILSFVHKIKICELIGNQN